MGKTSPAFPIGSGSAARNLAQSGYKGCPVLSSRLLQDWPPEIYETAPSRHSHAIPSWQCRSLQQTLHRNTGTTTQDTVDKCIPESESVSLSFFIHFPTIASKKKCGSKSARSCKSGMEMLSMPGKAATAAQAI